MDNKIIRKRIFQQIASIDPNLTITDDDLDLLLARFDFKPWGFTNRNALDGLYRILTNSSYLPSFDYILDGWRKMLIQWEIDHAAWVARTKSYLAEISPEDALAFLLAKLTNSSWRPYLRKVVEALRRKPDSLVKGDSGTFTGVFVDIQLALVENFPDSTAAHDLLFEAELRLPQAELDFIRGIDRANLYYKETLDERRHRIYGDDIN